MTYSGILFSSPSCVACVATVPAMCAGVLGASALVSESLLALLGLPVVAGHEVAFAFCLAFAAATTAQRAFILFCH
jgi:hypothetical protein